MNNDSPNIEAAHQSTVISNTSVALPAAITLHPKTLSVLISVENAPIRISVNNNPPTASLGTQISADGVVSLSRAEAEACKLIRSAGIDATIQVAQYATP